MNWLKNNFQRVLFIMSLVFLTLLYLIPPMEFGSFLRNLHTALFFVFLVVTLFSALFIFTKINTQIIWRKFTFIFSLLGLFLITFAPTDGNYITGQVIFILTFTTLYSLISLGILIYGFFIKN